MFFQNPTTAVNTIARSLELSPGDEVLSTDHIYGALDRTWKYLCSKNQSKFIKAKIPLPIKSKETFLDIFFSYISPRTKVIFISHITSMTAMIFPVKEIINYAKKNSIITIIDGAHVPGHIPLDILDLDPDYYTGACHKWMCTPKGVSFLYVKKEHQEKVHPLIISWGWESDLPGKSKFLDWHQWQGTRDMTAFLTVPTAIQFLNQYNFSEISKKCRKMVIDFRKEFINLLDINYPCPDSFIAQMASIPIGVLDPVLIKDILINKYKIQVPVFNWEGQTLLRYSIQGYNSKYDLEKLLNATKEILK